MDISHDSIEHSNKKACKTFAISIPNIKTKTGRYKLGKEIQAILIRYGEIKSLHVDSVRIV